MFEHLTDLDPPEFDATFRERVVAKARARQRRTRVTVGSLALVPLLAVGGFGLYLRDQANQLEHVDVTGLVPADTLPPIGSDPLTTRAEPAEVPPISTPLNILIVGVDRRPPGSEVMGSRADTIAVVRIDPAQGRVGILSIPRDLWITDDSGTGSRINTFTDDGGLVPVVSDLLGIDINHYVEVDFDGFQSLIDLAGGVTIRFDQPARDDHTGFSTDAGCINLSGTDALAYARSRHLETFDADTGEWMPDPRSDLGRIARQQDLIQRVYAQTLAHPYSTTDKIRLVNDVVDDITVDAGLDLDGLLAIFNAATLIGSDHVDTYDLTDAISAQAIDGNAVLVADPAGIQTQVTNLLGQDQTTSANPTTPNSDGAESHPSATC